MHTTLVHMNVLFGWIITTTKSVTIVVLIPTWHWLTLQALLDDKTFCGLVLDEDNQDDLSADHIKKWIAQISREIRA